MTERERILIVDDDPDILDGLNRCLADATDELDVTCVQGGQAALDLLRDGDFSVVISDMDNRFMDGEHLMETVRGEHPDVARMIFSARADAARLHRVADDEHFYLQKGCSVDDFLAAVREACELHRWYAEHPRSPTTEDLLQIMVDFFTREVLRQKMVLADIPDGIRPYISRRLMKSMMHDEPEPLANALADESEPWVDCTSWTDGE